MARYTKTGTPNTIGQLNSELDNIATAINDTLSRKGDSPNQLETDLDMNSNRILNLPTPINESEAARLKDIVLAKGVESPITTLNLIGLSGVFTVGTIVQTTGYTTAGDGGSGTWIKTSNTAAASQSPTQLTLSSLTDSEGSRWDLVVNGKAEISVEALGAVATQNINNIITAISTAGYTVVCGNVSYNTNGLVVPNNTKIMGNKTTFTTTDTRFCLRSNGGLLDVSGLTFDGESSLGSNSVLVTSGGLKAKDCVFKNATTNAGYGEGLQISGTTQESRIENCLFINNDNAGMSMLKGLDVLVSGCYSVSNGGSGFIFNNYASALNQNIDNIIITSCWAINNSGTGFTFGNPYNDNNFNGDNFGHSNNVCTNVTGSDLLSFGNTVYGFTLSMTDGTMTNIQAQQNAFGGVLVNGNRININNPIISHNPLFGIDIGQGKVITVTGGEVSFNSATGGQGFLIEASQQVVVTGTYIHNNGGNFNANLSINTIGGTGNGRYFPLVASDIYLAARVACTGSRIGFDIKDNPFDVIDSNIYDGPDALLYTRYAVKSGNLSNLNATTRDSSYGATIASNKLVTPDICKVVSLNTTDTINSIRSRSNTFYEGATAYYEITAAGSGYTASTTTAAVSGDGSGATCTVFVNQGTVVGLRVDNKGSGYTSATVAITDSASGSGATATVKIGMDLVESETLLLMHNQAQTITRAGAITVDSPSGGNLSAPAKGSTRLRERFGSWIVEAKNY